MHRLELGDGRLSLYVRLTQRNLALRERGRLSEVLLLCIRVFRGFVGIPAGGNLLRGHSHSLEMNLTICGEAKMTSLNRRYRQREKPTDVLSFPLHSSLKSGGGRVPGRLCLGDIYICREVALIQATKFQVSYDEELAHLFVHGFLHLLGYDHEISKRAEREMQQSEEYLLNHIIGSKQWKNLSK